MRLKLSEMAGIMGSLADVFKKNKLNILGVGLYLYGSRVDDQKRGGDIDLLLRVPHNLVHAVEKIKFQINIEMQKRIGEQKIDILIMDQDPPKEPFHCIAIKDAILIKQW